MMTSRLFRTPVIRQRLFSTTYPNTALSASQYAAKKLEGKQWKIDLDKLSPEQKKLVESMIRVNQAGELGAIRIYQGQLAVLGRTADGPVLKHMLDQEQVHFNTFNNVIGANGIRPTLLTPLWHLAGFSLGLGTAIFGKESAMMCTEAVEKVIGTHYDDQLRELVAMGAENDNKELMEILKSFRNDELEHLDHAIKNDSEKAPLHSLASNIIQTGCKVAIWISSRI